MSALFDALLAALAALLLFRWAGLVLAAVWHGWRHRHPPPPPAELPPVTVLVPAHDEEAVLEGTVRHLLASDHPRCTIHIVDDGSTDGTPALADRLAAEQEAVEVLHLSPNRGKAAALTEALATVRTPHLVTVDADTLVGPTALRHLTGRLAVDPAVGSAAANVAVGNRTGPLTRFQSLEYITALHLDRRAQDALGCITTVPGAAAAYRTRAVRGVGGWSSDTRTEDTDLSLALLAAGHRIVFEPRARALTEAPLSWTDLFRQRRRWLTGFLQCLYKYRGRFFSPSPLGWLGLPNLLYVNLLVFLLPLPGWLGLTRAHDAIGTPAMLQGLAVAIALDLAVVTWAYGVDREDPKDLLWLPAQRLVWPVFLTTVFGVVLLDGLRGVGRGWGGPRRSGALARANADGALRVLERRDPTQEERTP